MQVPHAESGPPARRRLSPASLATVLVGGVLFLSWFWLSIGLFVAGLSALPAFGSGLLILAPWLLLMQGAVRLERRRAVAIHGLDVIIPARRRSVRTGAAGWWQDRWFELGSGALWRGILHHHLAILVAGLFCLTALALLWAGWSAWQVALLHGPLELGPLTLSRWALGVTGMAGVLLAATALVLGALADRGLARLLISGSEEDLREQVAELAERRRGAVDAAAQERARIERDLHDGVQPRLVTLAMTLGIARGAVHSDPDRAEALLLEAHTEAKAIMTDLRQLARGIHPAVLTDRGLDAALSALAARSRVPVRLDVDLAAGAAQPLDREREAVAYFVVAEALTNIAKHAGARRAEVHVHDDGQTLRVQVEDDGRGGARVHRDGISTGLAGLGDRVRATGGRLTVGDRPGGGTVLTALIPREHGSSSSQRAAAPPRPAAPRPAAVPRHSPVPLHSPTPPAPAEHPVPEEDPR